jgi:hypothetical protein
VEQLATSKDVNMESLGATALEAVTRQQPMYIKQTENIRTCCSEPQSV